MVTVWDWWVGIKCESNFLKPSYWLIAYRALFTFQYMEYKQINIRLTEPLQYTPGPLKNTTKRSQLWQTIYLRNLIQKSPNLAPIDISNPIQINSNMERKIAQTKVRERSRRICWVPFQASYISSTSPVIGSQSFLQSSLQGSYFAHQAFVSWEQAALVKSSNSALLVEISGHSGQESMFEENIDDSSETRL